MALTKVTKDVSSTPGIVDNSNATAITINSSETVGIGRTNTDNGFILELAGSIYMTGSQIVAGDSTSFRLQKSLASTSIDFQSNVAETEVRIDSSGNMLIGTTTINTGTLGTSNKFLEVAAGTASGSGTLVLSRDTSGNNNELGGIRFVNANNADDDGLDADGKFVAAISARSVTSDSNASDDSGANLQFYTKPEAGNYAERMRIISGGMVYMNGATGSFGTPSFTDGILFTYKDDNEPHIENKVNHANTMGLYKFQNSNGTAGSISLYSSSVTFNTSSDYRLKEDVNYTWDAISKLEQLKPCEFKFKADSDDVIHQGFLAHEVDNIVPTSVFGEKDGTEMQQIDHSKLVPLLTKAIQELSTKLEAAEARITTLEG